MRSALDFATPPPPPPPPPLPPPFQTVVPSEPGQGIPSSSSSSYSPSLIIITGIIAFVIIVSASIHLLLRFLSRRSSSAAPFSSPQQGSSSSSSAASTSWPPDRHQNGLAESLPLFSLASSLASVPKSSPDCAVCLSAFRPHDELRLLPACRHAFHAACIDTWLRSTPSCPLCRSSVSLLQPSAPPAPPAQPAMEEARGTSFRIEIGSVSRRSTPAEEDSIGASSLPPRHPRTYSLGSSFEYVVEEEVEAVLARIRRRPDKVEEAERGGPPPPGAEIAEAAGGGGRGWLKEYVDRLASSASSSFNSLRFSGRWSHRFDGGHVGVGGGRRESWDSELEESGLSTFYRWLTGS